MTSQKTEIEYQISDGNAHESYEDWDDLVEAASGWYHYMLEPFTDYVEAEHLDGVTAAIYSWDDSDLEIGDVDGLNMLIAEMETKIAEACGHSGIGMNARNQMGLNLSVGMTEN